MCQHEVARTGEIDAPICPVLHPLSSRAILRWYGAEPFCTAIERGHFAGRPPVMERGHFATLWSEAILRRYGAEPFCSGLTSAGVFAPPLRSG